MQDFKIGDRVQEIFTGDQGVVVKNLVPTRWVDANGTSHPTNGYEEFTVIQNLING